MSPKPKVHMNSGGKKVNPIHSAARHRNSPIFFANNKIQKVEAKMNELLGKTDGLQYLVKLSQLKLEASVDKKYSFVLKKSSNGNRHKIISREKMDKKQLQGRNFVEADNVCDPSDKMRRENLLKKAFDQGTVL